MRVVTDDRERDGRVARCLDGMVGVTVEVRRLALGDYLIDERLLVERKTVSDFAASVCDGRLFRQARRLAAHRSQQVCVVIEGTSREAERMGVSREAMQGAVISLTLVFGVPLLRSRDAEETARLLVYAGGQMARAATGLPHRAGRKSSGRERTRIEMLQAIPGIGPSRARALLVRFGGIPALVSASLDEIAKVDGIGRVMAARVQGVVGDSGAGLGVALTP